MSTYSKGLTYNAFDLQLSYTTHWSVRYKYRSKLLLILGGIATIFFSVIFITSNYDISNIHLIAYGLLLILVSFYFKLTVGKRMLKKLPNLAELHKVMISETGIKIESDTISSSIKWQSYHSAILKPEIILLYHNELLFNMLPARFFSDEEFEAIKVLVKNKISDCSD